MIEVKLLPNSTSPNPLRSLYLAYRVATSSLTPVQIMNRIESERITEDQMMAFIEERFKVNHVSPLQQVSFEFAISGVSRAFSHQFVRHHVGIDIEQQSQRYVSYSLKQFPYTMPSSIANIPLGPKSFQDIMHTLQLAYDTYIAAGVPEEDARFVLPNACHTNLKLTVNFTELQHMADLRLCTRAQWEFRHVMGRMRGEVMRSFPWLGKQLGPKCMSFRLGYCDEPYEAWAACPFSRSRPHKSEVIPA